MFNLIYLVLHFVFPFNCRLLCGLSINRLAFRLTVFAYLFHFSCCLLSTHFPFVFKWLGRHVHFERIAKKGRHTTGGLILLIKWLIENAEFRFIYFQLPINNEKKNSLNYSYYGSSNGHIKCDTLDWTGCSFFSFSFTFVVVVWKMF